MPQGMKLPVLLNKISKELASSFEDKLTDEWTETEPGNYIYWYNILVTFYTVSKVNTFCGPKDLRIGLSKLWTLINIFVSTAILSVIFLVYIVPNSNGIIRVLGFFGIPLHILGVVLTVIFLFYDSLCSTCSSCCCECCRGQSEDVVFDPRFPEKNLVWREEQVQLTNNKNLTII